MNVNVASQNNGVLAFTGIQAAAVSPPVDVRRHNHFAFTFQVTADIAVEAVFEIEAAPASDADPCLPGAWHNVEEVMSCDWLTAGPPAADSKVAIPVGTVKGTICTATLPCKPDAFVRVVPTSGDTGKVLVVAILGGPR